MSNRLKKRKRAESTHKERVERRRQRVRTTHTQSPEPQLLYSRKQAARLLGYKSIDSIVELEHQGKLTPISPTGKKTGQVNYRHGELEAIASGEAE